MTCVKRITLASVLKSDCRACKVRSKEIRQEATTIIQWGAVGDLDQGCGSWGVRNGQFCGCLWQPDLIGITEDQLWRSENDSTVAINWDWEDAERVDLKGWCNKDKNVGSQCGHAKFGTSVRHPGGCMKEAVRHEDLEFCWEVQAGGTPEYNIVKLLWQPHSTKNLHRWGNTTSCENKLRYQYIMAQKGAWEQVSPCPASRQPSEDDLSPLYVSL